MVTTPKAVTTACTDPTFRQPKTARRKRGYAVPVVAHTWAHRAAEEPLTALWTAQTLYPQLFADLDMAAEVEASIRTSSATSSPAPTWLRA
jgi:iron complex transport system substrate-binding protein